VLQLQRQTHASRTTHSPAAAVTVPRAAAAIATAAAPAAGAAGAAAAGNLATPAAMVQWQQDELQQARGRLCLRRWPPRRQQAPCCSSCAAASACGSVGLAAATPCQLSRTASGNLRLQTLHLRGHATSSVKGGVMPGQLLVHVADMTSVQALFRRGSCGASALRVV
jgi:hypothetical protein